MKAEKGTRSARPNWLREACNPCNSNRVMSTASMLSLFKGVEDVGAAAATPVLRLVNDDVAIGRNIRDLASSILRYELSPR